MRSALYAPLIGVWGGYDPAATAFFKRLTKQPTGARATLYSNLFASLRQNGILPLLDALWIRSAADAQASQLNLVQNAFNLTDVNAPTFTVDRGVAGNGTTSYSDTNFNPATAVNPNFIQNSGHISIYDRGPARANAATAEMGYNIGANPMTEIATQWSDGLTYTSANMAGAEVSFTSPGVLGHFIASRTTATLNTAYYNGVSKGTSAVAAVAVPNTSMVLSARKTGLATVSNFSTDQIAAASVGAGLTAAQATAFYNAIQAFMTGVGANV